MPDTVVKPSAIRPCRLLPFVTADGPFQMAADEAMLDSAAAGSASLRFYAWAHATVSLGYFQPESVRLKDPRLAALPFVRRPSGGMTLVHQHELTYAVALPAGPPWQTPGGTPWLCRMHAIIASVLNDRGVAAGGVVCQDASDSTSVLCFAHHTPGDLVVGTAKVVGSAQRRQRGALLQHGAVLLESSPSAPQLPGVRELTSVTIPLSDLAVAIGRAWERETGWPLVAGNWTDAESSRIDELARAKYSDDRWNRKR